MTTDLDSLITTKSIDFAKNIAGTYLEVDRRLEMSATLKTEVEVVNPEGRTSTVLKRDALGLPALFFCIATAAAPMTALLFNVPVIVSGSGWAAPAAFLVATVMLMIFTVGYEMAPNYGEETRRPKHIFGRATFGTLIVLGIVYVLVTYAFVEGWGTSHVAQAVKAQFSGQTISAFYPLTGRYVGTGLTSAFKVLIITSSFACQLAFFNTAARYVFALGRERLLPSALGRTHGKHKTPHVAAIVLAVALALYILAFVISDSSTIAALTKLATWSPLLGVLGILGVQALVSFAIVRYFWTVDRAHFHPWRTLIAPLLRDSWTTPPPGRRRSRAWLKDSA